MTKRPEKGEDPIITCTTCMKEIPRSVAKSHEGPDYIYYFCGSECFSQWLDRNAGVQPTPKKN